MTQTEQFQLNQWDKSDRIMMEDFNADNAKIEQILADHTKLLSKCGNCRIEAKTYMGTGTYGSDNQTSITFTAEPLLVFVGGFRGAHMCLFPGHTYAESSDYENRVSWNGSSVSWYSVQSANYQYNAKSTTYYAVALCAAD